jgi:uncharacterized membrane protein
MFVAFATLAACGILVLSAPLLRAQSGTFSSFDAPGAGGRGTFPIAINRSGLIVGYFTDSSNVEHGFIRDPNGTFTVVDVPGQTGTQITAVNSRGLVTGYNDIGSGDSGFLRYRNGEFGKLNVPGTKFLEPAAMNDIGQIAGTAILTFGAYRGFIWSQGHSVTFTVPDAGYAVDVLALNSSGVVAGKYLDVFKQNIFHAFLRDGAGNVTSFDATDSSLDTAATAINASGQTTGWYTESSGVFPFFRDVDGTITVFTVGTTGQGQATSINDNGVAVGFTYDIPQNSFQRDVAGNVTALTLPFSNTASIAAGINLSGVVVGTYYDQAYVAHGWVMTP